MKKAIKDNIIKVCTECGLSEFWTACMIELYDLQKKSYKQYKQPAIIADIVSVSRSGMSRKVKFSMIRKNGMFQDITPAFAALYGAKLQDDYTFRVNGCGMDMIFHTVYIVFSKMVKHGGAGDDYNFFCRYTRF